MRVSLSGPLDTTWVILSFESITEVLVSNTRARSVQSNGFVT